MWEITWFENSFRRLYRSLVNILTCTSIPQRAFSELLCWHVAFDTAVWLYIAFQDFIQKDIIFTDSITKESDSYELIHTCGSTLTRVVNLSVILKFLPIHAAPSLYLQLYLAHLGIQKLLLSCIWQQNTNLDLHNLSGLLIHTRKSNAFLDLSKFFRRTFEVWKSDLCVYLDCQWACYCFNHILIWKHNCKSE